MTWSVMEIKAIGVVAITGMYLYCTGIHSIHPKMEEEPSCSFLARTAREARSPGP